MGQHWQRDAATGDYVMSGGAPVETDSLSIAAYHRVKTRAFAGRDEHGNRLGWMYAPSSRYGSLVHTLKKRVNDVTDPLLERIIADAVAPLLEDGRAGDVDVRIVASTRKGIEYQLSIFDRQNKAAVINFSVIGV